MRGAFIKTLVEVASKDERVFLLTGDLGYSVLEQFAERFPDRFMNVGVAEQNMIGIATGLAEAGFIPFAYSIVTFASLRPYEFIRHGAVLHEFPVRIVGVGGGFEYSHNGPTHYGLEDVGVMRVQPGLTVIAPADAQQTTTALRKTYNQPGPIYYRLGKDDKLTVPGLDGSFELGELQIVRNGADVLIVSMGAISAEVVEAADELASKGVQCTVAIVSSLNPAPTKGLIELLSRFSMVLSVEAHYANGGVGSLVAETIAENNIDCRLVRCAVKTTHNGASGSQKFLHNVHGISRSAVVDMALKSFSLAQT